MLEDDRSFNDLLLVNRFFDNRHTNKNSAVGIIPECQLAYNNLLCKNIKINCVSTYDDQYLFILLDHLSEQNIDMMEELIMTDERYFYNNEENKYGIRVSDINQEASFELLELTNVLYSQKNYQKELVRVN